MRLFFSALLPLFLLAFLVAIACILAYGLLQLLGDFAPLDKIISKMTQFLLILCIFPLKAHLKLSWQDLGFAPNSHFFKQVLHGFFLALITLLPVMGLLYLLEIQVYDESKIWSMAKIFEKVGLGLLLSLLIAIFEEIIFRGLLLSCLQRTISLLSAIFMSSFYYALLHFLKSKSIIPYSDIGLNTGYKLMLEAYANWFNPEIFSALLALFVVGTFLATLRTRYPSSLGLCIGCHCGWVWQIKVCKDIFNVNPQSDYLYLVSGYDGVIGPLVSFWLSLAVLGLLWLTKQPDTHKLRNL